MAQIVLHDYNVLQFVEVIQNSNSAEENTKKNNHNFYQLHKDRQKKDDEHAKRSLPLIR